MSCRVGVPIIKFGEHASLRSRARPRARRPGQSVPTQRVACGSKMTAGYRPTDTENTRDGEKHVHAFAFGTFIHMLNYTCEHKRSKTSTLARVATIFTRRLCLAQRAAVD